MALNVRVCSVGGTSCTTGTTLYAYDADGLRVAKYAGASLSSQYLYNLSSQMITELDGSGNWVRGEIFANSVYLGTYDNASGSPVLSYSMADWLGTIRTRTDSSGTITETVTNLPFGDGMSINGAEASHKHFTGKLHDDETGLDYFGARYFSSGQGRFLTPDWSADPTTVPYGHFETPQTLNLYAYVGNNPVTDTDPDGHDEDFNNDSPDGAASVKESDSVAVKGESGNALTDAGQAKPSAENPAQQSTNTQTKNVGSNDAEVHGTQQQATPPKQGEPGGRQLDANGKECKDLANKIDNVVKSIGKRDSDLAKNPYNLPETAPAGSKLSASVEGHKQLIVQEIDNLAGLATQYNNKCGGGQPPPTGGTGQEATSRSFSMSPATASNTARAAGWAAVGAMIVRVLTVAGTAAAVP